MAYEIPKNLKYSEKIIFNLSLPQAFWIGLFGFTIFALFTKTTLAFEAKIVLSIILALLAVGFAFFGLAKHSLDAARFLLNKRQVGYTDKKMDSFIEAKRIDKNSVFTKDGSAKAIIHVQPINFHILAQNQQKAIIQEYRDFLNSLDFPIQIAARTVNLNLDEYMAHLEAKARAHKNKLVLTQFNEFRDFTKNYFEENAVKNRLFYIIVPSPKNNGLFSKEEDLLNVLDIRAKLCQEKLKACNLSTKRLNTNELVSLLASYFEGFVESGSEYRSALTLLGGISNAK